MDEFKYKIALGLWQGLTMDKQRVKFLRDHYNTNHKLLNKLMYDYLFSLKDPSIHADLQDTLRSLPQKWQLQAPR